MSQGRFQDGREEDDRLGSPRATASEHDLASQTVAELSERLRPRLVTIACRILGDRAAAEDATQEAMRRCLESARGGRIADLQALPSFLLGVVRNVCRERRRSSVREGRALGRMAAESAGDETEALPSVLDRLISEERCTELNLALAELKSDERELLRLIYHEGREPDEIAAELKLKPGAYRVRKHRALQRLGEVLGAARRGNNPGRSTT